jgi:hypothetical protein
MYNKDVIFAANSQSVDVTKFFNFVNTVVQPVNGITTTGIDIETWRVLSHSR